jgi:hypothetical protein
MYTKGRVGYLNYQGNKKSVDHSILPSSSAAASYVSALMLMSVTVNNLPEKGQTSLNSGDTK